MAIPVVIATNGIGLPVRSVGGGAPVMQVAANGLGMPVVLSDFGVPFVVLGLEAPPVVLVGPTINGDDAEGSILTVDAGSASGQPTPTASYQWLSEGVAIPGATGATFDTTGRGGEVITVRVTWSNGIGSPAIAISDPITILDPQPLLWTTSGNPLAWTTSGNPLAWTT